MSESGRAGLKEAVAMLVGLSAVAGGVIYGAANKLNSGEKAVEGAWAGDSFVTLGWIGLLVLAISTARAIQQRDDGVLRLVGVGIGGQLLFVGGVAGVSLAWAAERQNYWDAYHFAILVWNAILGAVCALICVILAARRGSRVAQFLIGPTCFWVLVALAVWTWTWSSTVQDFEAAITRSFYLATHR